MAIFIRCSVWKMSLELGAAGLVPLHQFAQSRNIFDRSEIPSFAATVESCSVVLLLAEIF